VVKVSIEDLSIYRRVAIGLPIWTHITWINRNFDEPLTSIRFTVDLHTSSMGMDGLSIIFIKGSRLSKPFTLKIRSIVSNLAVLCIFHDIFRISSLK